MSSNFCPTAETGSLNTYEIARKQRRVEKDGLDVTSFYPSDPSFHTDPYPFYAALRDQENAGKLTRIGGGYESYWIFSHKLVTEVCNNDGVFQKPGKDRNKDVKGAVGVTSKLGDGIFYMDEPRHGEVRAIMNTAFDQSLDKDKVTREARTIADQLLAAMAGRSSCEFVGEYAAQLPMRIFMNLMGIPGDHAAGVDEWVRAALRGHDIHGAPTERLAGATATMALRSYFLALGLKCKKGEPPLGETGLIGAMKKNVPPDESATPMSMHEAMNTAVQFALGGYLSTQFLIASGVYTLLRLPDQWDQLLANRALLESAVQEMVRYEAPFQIADRWVAKGQSLNGFTFEVDSKLAVVYGSANRDTDVYENADDFLIERKPGTPAYGFGLGIHNCIGAPLARVVTRVALDALLDHYPRARLGTLGPWSNDPYYRSISHMSLLLR